MKATDSSAIADARSPAEIKTLAAIFLQHLDDVRAKGNGQC